MYVDTAKTFRHGKTYCRHLLRDSYRENGKVKHHTIANLSRCTEEEIEAIKLALRYKGRLEEIGPVHKLDIKQGIRVGAVCFLKLIAERINFFKVLGDGQQAKLAMWQIFAGLINPISCMNAVRLAHHHCAHELLGLKPFNEAHLIENLSWLYQKQESIEIDLFYSRYPKIPSQLFWFESPIFCSEDLNNSWIEADGNTIDPRGLIFLVVVVLADQEFIPVALRVFKKRTSDVIDEQIRLLAKNFGVDRITRARNQKMVKHIGDELVKPYKDLPSIKYRLLTVMLSYLLQKEVEKYWHPIGVTFEEGIDELGSIQTVEINMVNTTCRKVLTPAGLSKRLLEAANINALSMIDCIEQKIILKQSS